MVDKSTRFLLIMMAFSPLLGFILRGIYDTRIAVLTFFGNAFVLIFIALWLSKGWSKIKFPAYALPLLLLSVYVGAWDFFNGNVAERGVEIVLFRNYHFFSLVTLLIIENSTFSKKFIKRIVFLLTITIIPAILVSMIQATFDPFFFTPESYFTENAASIGNMYEMRPPSIFAYLGFNDVALSFIPILSLVLGYRMRYNYDKLVTGVLMFLGGLVCFATNARYAMINFVTVISQVLVGKRMNIKKILLYVLVCILGLIVILLVLQYIGYDLGMYLQERLLDTSANTRLMAFSLIYKYLPQHPIFGTGVRVGEDLYWEIQYISSQIHVGYLSLLYEYGIVGGILTYWVWYLLFKDLRNVARMTKFYASLFGFVTFLLANAALVQYDIYLYGIVYLFVFSKHFKDEHELAKVKAPTV